MVAAHQQATREWWESRRAAFDCYISQVVIDEASAGDATEIQKRLAIVGSLKTLELSESAATLTMAILSSGILPPKAGGDAAHVAVAAINAIDYMLTWNCKHLANAQIARRIAKIIQLAGYRMPIICTPVELMGE